MRNWRKNRRSVIAGLFCAAFLATTAVADDLPFSPQADVVFVPTPQAAVNKMLELAGAGPDDIVYDLGSGDGRIVITAARDFGVRKAVGVDIDPGLVETSIKNAYDAGVIDRVKFVEGNFFEFDFSEATVLTMYLLPSLNIELRPRILELKPGTRIVSHAFDMGEWREDDYAKVEEDLGFHLDVYLWIVPARIEGAWQWDHGGDLYQIGLTRKFQEVSGKLHAFGQGLPISRARLSGKQFSFEGNAFRHGRMMAVTFDGTVSGDIIEGMFIASGNTDKVVLRRID